MTFLSNRGKGRLLIVGIDGATYRIINPLVKAGNLPNLRRLIESGSRTKLISTIHPMSPQAWTSFHTGVNPWKHGIFHFSSLDIGRPFSPITWRDIRVASIVELLDCVGINTIWNNLLGAYPFPKLQNGIIVGGRTTPKGTLIYPEHLQGDVRQLFPQGYEHHIDLLSLAVDGKISEKVLLSKLLVHTEHQTRLTEYLMKTQPWDLCYVMFDATDIGQHVFWRYLDDKHPNYDATAPGMLKQAIAALYRKVDESIGRLLQAAPKDTDVMVLSDHGFSPLYATVNLNAFLVRAGYTTPMLPMHRYNPRRALRGISSRLRRFQSNDQKQRPIYKSLKIKWKKTSMYAHGYMGNLFVNLRGREPHGCISQRDYEKIVQGVIEDLHKWENPITGDPMVRAVHRSPASITLQHCPRGVPDLVIEWFDYKYAGIHPGSYYSDFEEGSPGFSHNLLRSADHTLEGILVCAGPHFESLSGNVEGYKLSICDMAPLIMALMEMPLPDHFDGAVPPGLLHSEVGHKIFHRRQSKRRDASVLQTDYSDDEQSEIADRLRGLGYLE